MQRFTLSSRTIIYLSLFTIVGITFFAIFNNWWNLGLFWDLDIYQRAALDGLKGLDPYRQVDGMAFVYHPLILHIFSGIQGILPLRIALTVFYFLSLGWVLFELRADLKSVLGAAYKNLDSFVMPLLVATAFFVIGVTTIATGNMTGYLHFTLIALLLRNMRLNGKYSSVGVMLLIGVLSAIKPYFLAYMLINLLDTGSIKGKLAQMFIAVATFLGIWATGFLFYPDQMQAFLHNIAGLQSNGRVDIGINFYRLTYELGMSKLAGLMLHSAILLLIVAYIWRGIRKLEKRENTGSLILALAYFALSLINPRMKEYDLFPALAFLFVFWHAYNPAAKQKFTLFSLFFVLPILILIVTYFLGVAPGYVQT